MPCTEKNILQREGTSNLNRVLQALSASYAQPDERDTADLLLFAQRYAAYLNYYKPDNTPDGNWEALMKMDISVTLAVLIKTDIRAIADYKKLLYKKISLAETEADVKKDFRFLFDCIFTLVKIIDDQYKLIPGNLDFSTTFKNVITLKMQSAFLNLFKLFNDFKSNGWIDNSSPALDSDAPFVVFNANDFDITALSADWGTPSVDPIITLPSFPIVKDNIVHIINHNIFNAQIDILWKGISEIITAAAQLFEQTLNSFPAHTPHYALFISFIKLFRHAQDQLNIYTKRHLDFYYKDTLLLANKPAVPDAAHIVFGLQKNIVKHLVQKDTLFKGGKDSTGKEITYALTDDIVVNTATVNSIQSQQIHPVSGNFIASPVAASEDGQGSDIKAVDKSWFTFGDINKSKVAQPGFAIASNLLFLKEGARTIIIAVRFSEKLEGLTPNLKTPFHWFKGRLTAEKGWHEIPGIDLFLAGTSGSVNTFLFRLRLSPDDPPVIPYAESVHKENFAAGLPVVQCILQQDADNNLPYQFIAGKKIQSVTLSVTVNGVKDLALSNDTGTLDAAKPFKPFGDFPDNAASFYIGSKEIFQKELNWIDFNTEWEIKNGPGETQPSLSNARYLRQSNWNTAYPVSTLNRLSFAVPGSFIKAKPDFTANEILNANTKEGFLRLQLQSSAYSLFSHMTKIQNQLNSITLTENDNKVTFSTGEQPPVPAEIFLNNFSIDYAATATISFTDSDSVNNHLFYHITPFGFAEVHPRLISTDNNTEPGEKITLLKNTVHSGELFIGLDNAAPNLVINILFQVADGSSNPLKNPEQLKWFYLSGQNNWKSFDKKFIIDYTKNFTQSGIVIITLPDDINADITLFKNGLFYIKTAADANCDAVCKMIMIQAQAARVTLLQDETKQIEFRETRPASSIAKLVNSDAAIKTINQPFDSFDGRIKETDDHFYTRVSERLRHKQRAITIWDYEHIILEAFPQIFKTRCLNHSGFYFKGAAEVFCENYPGHVTIITIPDQKNKTNINPLRPYTPIGLLQNINDYLITIISPFVKLHVKNPAFEEIQVDFKVKFYDNLDESFYIQLLNDEIEKFLCPWAYDSQAEISFGGKIRKSAILNFIEERSYVDYVTCFKMNQVISRNGSVHTEEKKDIEVAEGTTSRSLLVSYYDEQTGIKHIIQSPATCDC